ncbi:MAG: response regulator transcription factor [Candidatus Gracilibacteria bacterium]|nr:response regulator transcription factor [Candidatus Gracilibacteria bacterium]
MNHKKILLIEDNKEISKNIKEFLELENFSVTCCFDGESGLQKAVENDFDLVILDIGLPKINGFLVCEKILKKKNIPILFLTAREFIEDRIFGLKLGAYDYIVKPFDLRELELRIEVAMKKSTPKFENIFQKENISLDFVNHIFSIDKKDILIPQKEIEIIQILIKNSPNIVSRSEIIESIWGESALFESDGKLDVHISNIRSKLGKDFISTVKGVGYRVS